MNSLASALMEGYCRRRSQRFRYFKLNQKRWGEKFWESAAEFAETRGLHPDLWLDYVFRAWYPQAPPPEALKSPRYADEVQSQENQDDAESRARLYLNAMSSSVAVQRGRGREFREILADPGLKLNVAFVWCLANELKLEDIKRETAEPAAAFLRLYPHYQKLLGKHTEGLEI